MRAVAAFVATGLLAGCASPPRALEPVPPAAAAPSVCNATALSGYVGRAFSPALGETMQGLAHARTLRLVRPGMAVTMDYREDRLTVRLDAKDAIERVGCG